MVSSSVYLPFFDGGFDASCDVGGHHDLVVDEAVLLHVAEHEAAGHQVAHLDVEGLEVPLLGVVQRLHVDTAGQEGRAAGVRDGLQGTLDAVEDVVHDAGAQLHLQRSARALHRITDGEAGSLLVALNGGRVARQLDDLADQLEVTHAHLTRRTTRARKTRKHVSIGVE